MAQPGQLRHLQSVGGAQQCHAHPRPWGTAGTVQGCDPGLCLAPRCSAWPRFRWAPCRQVMHLSVGSASVSPGCPPSPTITWQQGFMTVSLFLCPAAAPGEQPSAWQRHWSLSWCWNQLWSGGGFSGLAVVIVTQLQAGHWSSLSVALGLSTSVELAWVEFSAGLAAIHSSVLCCQDLLPCCHALPGAPAPAWPLWPCPSPSSAAATALPVLLLVSPCPWQCPMDTSLSPGTVAVWNLLTKSLLQCVHQPDASLKLYPFRCFLAHDQAVRSIEWCKADR